jgi:hypothetical protein
MEEAAVKIKIIGDTSVCPYNSADVDADLAASSRMDF